MKRILLVLPFLFIFILAFAQEKNKVLLINSYHQGLSWTDNITSGLQEVFDTSQMNIDLSIEYMDSKRFTDSAYLDIYFNFIKKKYASDDFDLIITSDDNAFNFIQRYRDSIFSDIPHLFCGLNHHCQLKKNTYGICEELDYSANIHLIKRLHPNLNKLYIITDNTTTGEIIYQRNLEILRNEFPELHYEFLVNLSFEELKTRLSKMKKGNVVLLSVFTKDIRGNYFPFQYISRELSSTTTVPIYGYWNFYLDYGIVGGKVNNGYQQGKHIAHMAVNLLKGVSPRSRTIPSESFYMFDYKELKRFGIKSKNLPAGAIVINGPEEFFQANKDLLIKFLLLLLLLVGLIVTLIYINRIRRLSLQKEKKHRKEIEVKNENLQLAKNKLEEANRLKSAFLANISHEVRTPMNGILGFSRLLADSENLDQKERRFLKIIRESGQLLLNMINDIIDISKIESNQFKINYADHDLHEILSDLNHIFTEEISRQRKDIALKERRGRLERQFFLRTDAPRLRQVFYNLLHNAVKFTEAGEISFGYTYHPGEIKCFVSDTGIGIGEKELEFILEHFRQADERETRKFGGAGLGLTVSKGILDNMRGTIRAESKQNEGTTFYFTIPYHPASKNTLESMRDIDYSAVDWKNKKILVVEDADISYELLKKFLKPTSIEIVRASDGEEAVRICSTDSSIDLVLMDIQLPVMDGLTATSIIKNDRKNLPIIAQTANALSEDRYRITAAGCDEYIAKPIDRNELYQKMYNFLANSNPHRS